MLEKDQPVRDGTWTSAEIELINEKVPFPPDNKFQNADASRDATYNHQAHNLLG